MTLKQKCATACLGLALGCPAAAPAAPPADFTATPDGRQVEVSWVQSADAQPYVIEAASSEDLDADGSFADANLTLSELLAGQVEFVEVDPLLQALYTSDSPLPPGRHWVHVATRSDDPLGCPAGEDQPCLIEWSARQMVEIPDPLRPSVSVSAPVRRLVASWTLQPDQESLAIEASTDPAIDDATGLFADPDPAVFELLAPVQTGFLGDELPPGTYHVHVGVLSRAPDIECAPDPPPCQEVLWSDVVSVSIEPDPGPAAPAAQAATPPRDTVVSFSRLTVPSSQRLAFLSVTAGMGEAGAVKVTGTVNVPGASKAYRFRTLTRQVTAGKPVKLRPRLPARAARAVKKALRRGKRLKAKLTITATDVAGNSTRSMKTVRLKR